MPILNTIIPSLLSFVVFLSSFFIHTNPSTIRHSQQVEKKQTANKELLTPTVSPTPLIQQRDTDNKEVISQEVEGASPQPSLTTTTTPTSSPQTVAYQTQITTPTVTPQSTKTIHATSSISASGKTITLSMQYPSTGGAINGTMSGDCTGNIAGNYDGPTTGKLSGTAHATCPMGFVSIPVDITYSGILPNNSQAATISYTAAYVGKTENGTTTLNLIE